MCPPRHRRHVSSPEQHKSQDSQSVPELADLVVMYRSTQQHQFWPENNYNMENGLVNIVYGRYYIQVHNKTLLSQKNREISFFRSVFNDGHDQLIVVAVLLPHLSSTDALDHLLVGDLELLTRAEKSGHYRSLGSE